MLNMNWANAMNLLQNFSANPQTTLFNYSSHSQFPVLYAAAAAAAAAATTTTTGTDEANCPPLSHIPPFSSATSNLMPHSIFPTFDQQNPQQYSQQYPQQYPQQYQQQTGSLIHQSFLLDNMAMTNPNALSGLMIPGGGVASLDTSNMALVTSCQYGFAATSHPTSSRAVTNLGNVNQTCLAEGSAAAIPALLPPNTAAFFGYYKIFEEMQRAGSFSGIPQNTYNGIAQYSAPVNVPTSNLAIPFQNGHTQY